RLPDPSRAAGSRDTAVDADLSRPYAAAGTAPAGRSSAGRLREAVLRGRSEELLVGLDGPRRLLEQPARATPEVAQVDLALRARPGEPRRQRQGVVEDRRAGPGLLAHLGEDRPLGARGDDRLGNPLDPHARAPAAAAVARLERLERVDLVRARVLPEAEED